MEDIDYRELAIKLISVLNSRHGAGSEWTLQDMSPVECEAYNAALLLLRDCFANCVVEAAIGDSDDEET